MDAQTIAVTWIDSHRDTLQVADSGCALKWDSDFLGGFHADTRSYQNELGKLAYLNIDSLLPKPRPQAWSIAYLPSPIGFENKSSREKFFRFESPSDFHAAIKAGNVRDTLEIEIEQGIYLPAEIYGVIDAIENSRRILEHCDDWDGEGSPAYKYETWRNAIELIAGATNAFWIRNRSEIPAPLIHEGPEGSIDITWRLGQKEMVLNIEPGPSACFTFSGLDRSDKSLTLVGEQRALSNHGWILEWLMS